ncbi:MAG: hypothetical protein V1790_05965 [Planctomycetota bacterium]
MAIKRRVSDTGIYRHVERTIGTVESPYGERLIPADGQHILARMETLAELEPRHWQQHAKRLALGIMRSTTLPVKRPTGAEPAFTAERLLTWLERMIAARDAGDTDKALWRAFVVGRFYESLRVRPSEPLAVFGRRARNRGRNAGKGRAAKYQAMYPKWQGAIDESYRQHVKRFKGTAGKVPKWSYLQACVRVAKQFEVKADPKTVERHTKNPTVC